MKPYTCLSSEHYPLEIADLLCLDDTPDAKQIEGEAVVLLVGNQQKGIPDTLYQGRGYLLQQQKKGKKEVPARVAFHRTRPWWDILAAFCKPYRKHFFASGTNIYPYITEFITKNGSADDVADAVNQESVFSEIDWDNDSFTKKSAEQAATAKMHTRFCFTATAIRTKSAFLCRTKPAQN